MNTIKSTQVTEQDLNSFVEIISHSGFKLIYAILIFLIGLFICKFFKKSIKNIAIKYNVNIGVINVTTRFINIICLIILTIICLEIVGFPIKTLNTMVISLLGIIGISFGMAFKEVLSNLGSGLIMIFSKPFKYGDYISAINFEGFIYEIQTFNTVLKTPDNTIITIPNSNLINENIINYTALETRRIDLTFGVGYNSDLTLVKNVLEKIFYEDKRILQKPKPLIGLNNLGDSSMEIVAKPWVKTQDYYDVYYDIMENVKNTFDDNNIEIPFPTRSVYYKNEDTNIPSK